MRKELKNIAKYRKPSNDAFASVARSFGEANNRLKALAVESVRRAVEIQSRFVGNAYVHFRDIEARKDVLRRVQNLHSSATITAICLSQQKKAVDSQQRASAEAKVNAEPARRRTAAQSMPTKRKTGTVAKSQSGSKRSAKVKMKVGSVRRRKR